MVGALACQGVKEKISREDAKARRVPGSPRSHAPRGNA
jgi:hypothetical protein